mmetsp:Transcript_18506/g.18726  ORF Transcript_18506/g.18726 Transcript_18506/m.18726 type:complete len:461 (-) Transcript_18506:156-1538(-)
MNEDISDLYKDDNNDITERSKSSGNTMEGNSSISTHQQEKSSSQLERPSTLSIVFGFILTGIAVIGLAAYAYLFYRNRQKHYRTKRKIQESITYPSAIVAADVSDKSNCNVQSYASTNTNTQQSIPVPASRSSQTHANSTILSSRADDISYSEDISYLESSSSSSEDISDAFANELKRAASLDQQAWEEFQRKKVALDRSCGTLNRIVHNNCRIHSTTRSALVRSEKEEVDEMDATTAIETELNGTTTTTASFGKSSSFPYGDEEAKEESFDDENDNINDILPISRSIIRPGKQFELESAWEPYHSLISQSAGLPNDFFVLTRQDIENDHAESVDQQVDFPQRSTVALTTTDDIASTRSDRLSDEVSELSKYVSRRYERRKERRKSTQDRHRPVHDERYSSTVEGAELYPSTTTASNTMSIGMDGRVYVYQPHSSSNDDDSARMTTNSSSSIYVFEDAIE